ncbi:MAG: hypothetical protein OEY33_06755, partial [Bdellovibrionales bacterium]|nr:hypothetical protein [Bdellovibrionales bacterium]
LIKGNLQVQKIIENYFSNRQRTSFNQDLLISQNLRAVKKSNYRDLMGEQVSEKAGFIIYKVSELGVKESFSIQSKSLPVVYDTVKNTFAILTGKIVLNIKKGINLKSLSKRMKLKNFFFEDRMIFGNYEDLNSVLNLINKNDNVQSFEVEIIDSIPEPN